MICLCLYVHTCAIFDSISSDFDVMPGIPCIYIWVLGFDSLRIFCGPLWSIFGQSHIWVFNNKNMLRKTSSFFTWRPNIFLVLLNCYLNYFVVVINRNLCGKDIVLFIEEKQKEKKKYIYFVSYIFSLQTLSIRRD